MYMFGDCLNARFYLTTMAKLDTFVFHAGLCPQIFCCLQVVEGLDIVRQIEQSNTDRMDRPKSPVVISDAGEL